MDRYRRENGDQKNSKPYPDSAVKEKERGWVHLQTSLVNEPYWEIQVSQAAWSSHPGGSAHSLTSYLSQFSVAMKPNTCTWVILGGSKAQWWLLLWLEPHGRWHHSSGSVCRREHIQGPLTHPVLPFKKPKKKRTRRDHASSLYNKYFVRTQSILKTSLIPSGNGGPFDLKLLSTRLHIINK